MPFWPLLLSFLLLLLAAGLLLLSVRGRRRRALQRSVFDHADTLQALLANASAQVANWHGRVGQLAGDLGGGAQRALDIEPLIREARRDLLQHRLWLQQEGLSASNNELEQAAAALLRVQNRLQTGLQALQSAGDALAQATDAAHAAARREPPSLRRGG